MDIVGSMRRS